MKLSRPFCLAAAAVGMFLLSPASQMNQAYGDIIEFGSLSLQPENISVAFNSGVFDDPTNPTGIIYTDSGVLTTGEAFDYTVTVTAVSGVTDIFNTSGGLGDDNASNVPAVDGVAGRFQNDGTINIDVAITSGDVQVDGFVNFGLNSVAPSGGVGFRIDGVDYVRGGGADNRFGISLPGGIVAGDDIDVTFLDPRPIGDGTNGTREGTILRGFAFQLSAAPAAVPEPSSLALFGLVGLGFATRRRK